MSQRKNLSAQLAAALAGAVAALVSAGTALAQDSRLSSRLYNPDEIVRVEGRLNVQATIAFGEGEKIENVAVGDSESWQIAPNKRADLLFIKPLTETARTNMTVVTDRHTYFFDLVASPKAQPIYALRFTYATPAPSAAPAPSPALVAAPVVAGGVVAGASAGTAPSAAIEAESGAVPLTPAEQRAQDRRIAAAAKAARDEQRKVERQAARARAAAEAKRVADARAAEGAAAGSAARDAASAAAATPAPPAVAETSPAAAPEPSARPRNARRTPRAAAPAATAAAAPATAGAVWKRSGARELMPRTIYDDGRATYAVWPAGQPLPQLLVADAQGREVPVGFAVDGERIVIPGVPGRIILRANGKSGALEPDRPVVAARPDSAGR